MPFCPECHREYFDWVKICAYCQVKLVERLTDKAREQTDVAASEPLVTIASFSYPEEAHLARAKLESEGIDSFVANERIVTANWLYSNAVGGVQLQVRKSDVQVAKEILKFSTRPAPEKKLDSIVEDDVRCPKCNSTDVRYFLFNTRPVFISWLIFGFALPFMKRKWKCNSCGNEWKQEKQDQN